MTFLNPLIVSELGLMAFQKYKFAESLMFPAFSLFQIIQIIS